MDKGAAVSTIPRADAQAGWRPFVGALAAVFLGAVFLVAVYGKVTDPAAFAEVVHAERLDFWLPAETVAMIALALETAIGFALILNLRPLWVLLPTTALVLFFIVLTGIAFVQYLQGIQPEIASCGCFGNLVERNPMQAFWQDFLLMVPPLLLSFLGRPRGGPFPWRRAGAVGLLTVGVIVFARWAPDLPLDDLATRLKPGVDVSEVCVGSGEERVCLAGPAVSPRLTEGRHVVILADLTDPAFADLVGERLDEFLAWNEQVDYVERNPILVLHGGTKTDEGAFNMLSRAAPLDLLAAPRPLLRPLYRRLPRTFVVVDGRVVSTYDGLPSLSEIGR